MNFGRKRRERDLILDLVPMIDVIFQLVLFLLLATEFRKPDEGDEGPGIQVDLPRSSADAVVSTDTDLEIWMTADGAIYVDQKTLSKGELKALLRETADRDPKTLIVIKADAGVTHGRVVTVMDLARARGLERLAIATEPGEEER